MRTKICRISLVSNIRKYTPYHRDRSLVYRRTPSRLLWRMIAWQWDDNPSKFLMTEWRYHMMPGQKQREKGRTSNWNVVIRILRCDIVNVKRIHTVDQVAVRLTFVLLCFLDATVHLRELFQPWISKGPIDDNCTYQCFSWQFLVLIQCSGQEILSIGILRILGIYLGWGTVNKNKPTV